MGDSIEVDPGILEFDILLKSQNTSSGLYSFYLRGTMIHRVKKDEV